jgi:hypothetical protein
MLAVVTAAKNTAEKLRRNVKKPKEEYSKNILHYNHIHALVY